jgi:thioesterase domain-containing protein
VEELRRFRPEGPYLLLGFCFSGILAYEVGHQLHQLGMPPALLAIIDAAPRQQRTRVEMERQKFADFKQRDLRGKLAWVKRRAGGLGYKVGWKARWLVFDALRLLHVAPPAWLWDVKLASQRAIRAYRTPPSPCRVTLFRAAATDQASYYRASFWTRLAEGGVETREVVADGIRHDNMLKEPFVAALAEEVTRAIANTQETHSRANAADRT